jgi:hypothetical protein
MARVSQVFHMPSVTIAVKNIILNYWRMTMAENVKMREMLKKVAEYKSRPKKMCKDCRKMYRPIMDDDGDCCPSCARW